MLLAFNATSHGQIWNILAAILDPFAEWNVESNFVKQDFNKNLRLSLFSSVPYFPHDVAADADADATFSPLLMFFVDHFLTLLHLSCFAGLLIERWNLTN